MRLYLSSILALLLFGSCSKKESATDNTFEDLTNKNFILANSISDPAFPVGNGIYSTDLYHDWYMDACVLDDLRQFRSDGYLICDNGATKCDPTEGQQYILSWRLFDSNSKIEVTQTPYKDTLLILINDGTTLKYKKTKRWTAGSTTTSYTWTETWQKHN